MDSHWWQWDSSAASESMFGMKTCEIDFPWRRNCQELNICKKILNFHVAVSAPGLYSYGGLSFQMTQLDQECDDDEFIPLEVNFLVEKRNLWGLVNWKCIS